MVYRGDNILRGFDEDVRTHVRSEMEKDGITILTGCTVSQGRETPVTEFASHLSGDASIASDQVLFAIGRQPEHRQVSGSRRLALRSTRPWRHRRSTAFVADQCAAYLRGR